MEPKLKDIFASLAHISQIVAVVFVGIQIYMNYDSISKLIEINELEKRINFLNKDIKNLENEKHELNYIIQNKECDLKDTKSNLSFVKFSLEQNKKMYLQQIKTIEKKYKELDIIKKEIDYDNYMLRIRTFFHCFTQDVRVNTMMFVDYNVRNIHPDDYLYFIKDMINMNEKISKNILNAYIGGNTNAVVSQEIFSTIDQRELTQFSSFLLNEIEKSNVFQKNMITNDDVAEFITAIQLANKKNNNTPMMEVISQTRAIQKIKNIEMFLKDSENKLYNLE